MVRSLVLNLASVVQERPAAACVEAKLSFDLKEFISGMLFVHKQRSRSCLMWKHRCLKFNFFHLSPSMRQYV